MHIKKFEGSKISEILWAIKQELGPDAVILSTKEVSRSEEGLLCRPVIQVTAAVDLKSQGLSRRLPRTLPKEKKAPFQKTLENVVQSDLYQELKEIKKQLEDFRLPAQTMSDLPETASLPPSIHETWLEMKVMLKALREVQQGDPMTSRDQNIAHLYEQLTLYGIDPETAKNLCREVREMLPQNQLWKPNRIRNILHELLEGMVEVTGGFCLENRTARQKPDHGLLSKKGFLNVISLVGPTGVGKTTTTLKLGVTLLRRNQPVKLVSFEPEGEVRGDTLMYYANLFGIPAVKADSWDRLQEVVCQQKAGELILIDTAGRSHLDEKGVGILRRLSLIGVPLETHLVLSANIKGRDLSEMIDRFSVLSIVSLIFTKLDETTTYGPLFSAIGRKRKPLSYLTDGQQVPEDIVVATPQLFADLVLSGRPTKSVLRALNKENNCQPLPLRDGSGCHVEKQR